MILSYAAPGSLDEALAFLAEHGPDSIVLAGGMAVVPAIRSGLLSGKCIVNIKNTGISAEPRLDMARSVLRMGALVRHRDVERSSLIAEHFPCLAALERDLGSVQIRNHGTLAGNLCAAEPSSDPPCLMAALGARLTLATRAGTRVEEADDWILGPAATRLRPGELLTEIEIPLPTCREGAGYARLAPRQGLAPPLICAAARIELFEDGRVAGARVFVGAVGPRPQRMPKVEALIRGGFMGSRLASDIDAAVQNEIESMPDARCNVGYKTEVAGVLVRRAIADAIANSRGRRPEQ